MIQHVIRLEESKADEANLIAFAGPDLAARFLNMRQRLRVPEKDMYYWIKRRTPEELEQYLNKISSMLTRRQQDIDAQSGAELIYQDATWRVYHITTHAAAVKYGKNTRWCISGSKVWSNGENSEKYFNNYRNQGVEFYFYIHSNGDKFAVAIKQNNTQIFDALDRTVEFIPDAPDIEGLPHLDREITKADLKIDGSSVLITSAELALTNTNKRAAAAILEDNGIDTVIIHGGVKTIHRAIRPLIPSSVKFVIIEEGVEEIGVSAFAACENIVSIRLPESITAIGKEAFVKCTQLVHVRVPDSVATLGEHAFANCSALTSVDMGKNISVIPPSCFANCVNLKTVDIAGNIQVIDRWAFAMCRTLAEIELPKSLTEIGIAAFMSTGLTRVDLPLNITAVERSTFADCVNLQTVTMADKVRSINTRAFSHCTALKTVVLPKALQRIEESAFSGCVSLQDIAIPPVTVVADTAFNNTPVGSDDTITRAVV